MSPPFPSYNLLVVRDSHDALTNSTASPSPTAPAEHHSSGLSGWAIFTIIIVIVGAIIVASIFLMQRRRRAGGQSFSSSAASSGPLGVAKSWLSRATYTLRNPRARSASAGFEGISAGRAAPGVGGGVGGVGAAARNRSALDPDEAWDARVGHEADYGGYYEETELQSHHVGDGRYESLQHGQTAYTGAGGESRGGMPAENPFTDDNAVQPGLRSVSPRPVEDVHDGAQGHARGQHSPTRRSLFKEGI